MNEGFPLDKYLKKKLRLEPLRAIKVTLQIARQLEAEPSPRVVYPGRVLILKGGHVKLLPSGKTRDKRPAALLHPAYTSPEEIRGAKPDMRAALYSLGCTLHELLTGAPPYGGKNAKEVLRAHLRSPIPDVPEASEPVAAILRELLAKAPEERIQTPEELIAKLTQQAALLDTSSTRSARKTQRGPAHSGKSPRAARGRGKEQQHRRTPRRTPTASEDFTPGKKSYAFTIAGAVLGLLIAILVMIFQLRNMEEEQKGKLEERASLTRADQAKALAQRKQAAREAEITQLAEIENFLSANRKVDPMLRRDALILALDRRFNNSSYRRVLVEEVVNLWSTAAVGAGKKTEASRRTQAFEKQKLAAEALYAAGKLGKAIAKMMENHHKFKNHHGDAIDARVLPWSDELTKKWQATKTKVDRLLQDGRGEEAVDLLLAANEYGDPSIERETAILLRHAHAAASRTKSTDEQLEDDVKSLEEEFAEDKD